MLCFMAYELWHWVKLRTSLHLALFDQYLRFGDRGPLVVELQEFLISQGHLKARSNTGYFGSLTLAAVKAFQKAPNISPVSGFCSMEKIAHMDGFDHRGGPAARA
jgi:Putative peptidoglycan binding domain